MPGVVPPVYAAMVRYARGELPDLPVFAIPGGVNFISVKSLTEAVIASFTRGENGRGYLVGDENLRFKDFFGLFLGRPAVTWSCPCATNRTRYSWMPRFSPGAQARSSTSRKASKSSATDAATLGVRSRSWWTPYADVAQRTDVAVASSAARRHVHPDG